MGLAKQMIEYIVHGEETPEEVSPLPKVTSHLPRPCNVQPLGCVTIFFKTRTSFRFGPRAGNDSKDPSRDKILEQPLYKKGLASKLRDHIWPHTLNSMQPTLLRGQTLYSFSKQECWCSLHGMVKPSNDLDPLTNIITHLKWHHLCAVGTSRKTSTRELLTLC